MDNIDDLIGIICIAGEPYGEPKGSVSITENGEYDIKSFAYANVNVPQGIVPSGTLSIAENGEYDVTNYAIADINVKEYKETLLWTNPDLSSNFNAQNINLDVSGYDYIKIIYTLESDSEQYYKIFSTSELDGTYYPTIGFYKNPNHFSRYLRNSHSLYIGSCDKYGLIGITSNKDCKPLQIYGVEF